MFDSTPTGLVKSAMADQCFLYRIWLDILCSTDLLDTNSIMQNIRNANAVLSTLFLELSRLDPQIQFNLLKSITNKIEHLFLNKCESSEVGILAQTTDTKCNVCKHFLKSTRISWIHCKSDLPAVYSHLLGERFTCPNCSSDLELLICEISKIVHDNLDDY